MKTKFKIDRKSTILIFAVGIFTVLFILLHEIVFGLINYQIEYFQLKDNYINKEFSEIRKDAAKDNILFYPVPESTLWHETSLTLGANQEAYSRPYGKSYSVFGRATAQNRCYVIVDNSRNGGIVIEVGKGITLDSL